MERRVKKDWKFIWEKWWLDKYKIKKTWKLTVIKVERTSNYKIKMC